MTKCDCYFEREETSYYPCFPYCGTHDIIGRCNGTREQDTCNCGGHKEMCSFYPEYRSENTMPEVQDGDLIEYWRRIRNVFKCTKSMSDDIDALNDYEDVLIADYSDCDDTYYNWVETVTDIRNDITAIYRKQGKDYICIWEK